MVWVNFSTFHSVLIFLQALAMHGYPLGNIEWWPYWILPKQGRQKEAFLEVSKHYKEAV